MSSNPYDEHLDKNPANYQPLTPLQFLQRAALVYPNHTAIIHGNQRFTLCAVLRALPAAGVGAWRRGASDPATRFR